MVGSGQVWMGSEEISSRNLMAKRFVCQLANASPPYPATTPPTTRHPPSTTRRPPLAPGRSQPDALHPLLIVSPFRILHPHPLSPIHHQPSRHPASCQPTSSSCHPSCDFYEHLAHLTGVRGSVVLKHRHLFWWWKIFWRHFTALIN